MTSPYVIATVCAALSLLAGHFAAYIHTSENSRAFGFNTDFRTAMFPTSVFFTIVSIGIPLVLLYANAPMNIVISGCIPFVVWVITAIVYYHLKKHR